MKIITQLTAATIPGKLNEPRGILQVVHSEPVKGVHVKVALGSAGLFIRRGDAVVSFPLEVLIQTAAAALPELLTIAPSSIVIPVPSPAAPEVVSQS